MELARIDLETMMMVADAAPFSDRVQALLPPDTWADLTERGYPNVGYWPIVDVSPVYDPLTQRLGDPVLTVDQAHTRVTRTPQVIDLDAEDAARNQAQAAYGALMAGGITITSLGTPAVNGTYAVDPQSRADINAVVSYIREHSAFPAGLPALPVPVAGGAVLVPNPAVYVAIATAVADFVTAAIIAKNTGSAFPSATVMIS